MTGRGERALRAAATLAALAATSAGAAAAAHADGAPPGTTVVVTVTTPVTAPPPDPAPHQQVPKPAPAPTAKPKPTHVAAKPKAAPRQPRHVTRPAVPAAPVSVYTPPPLPAVHAATHAAVHRVARKHARRAHAAARHRRAKTHAGQHVKRHAKPAPKAKKPTHAAATPTVTRPAAAKRHPHLPVAPAVAVARTGGTSALLVFALAAVLLVVLASGVLLVFGRRRRRARTAVAPIERPAPATAPAPVPSLIEEEETRVAETPVVPPPIVEPVPAPPSELRCRVTAWRGYTKWCFYAEVEMDGEPVSLIESRAFRAPGDAAPDETAAARAALDELAARLDADGWQRTDRDAGRWYELEFVADGAELPSVPELVGKA